MARPEVHAGLADLAASGRDNATDDAVRVAYDRAWAAQITARNHALLALRNAVLADTARRHARIAATKRGGEAEATRLHKEADALDTFAVRHRDRAEERGQEGHDHMIRAAGIIVNSAASQAATEETPVDT